MKKILSWVRKCDEGHFSRIFSRHPELELVDARLGPVELDCDGLLLTGGEDISLPFLNQEPPPPAPVGSLSPHLNYDPERDAWEFEALRHALRTRLPVLAICRGHQLLNVALGGTLLLDIPGHDRPESKLGNIQPMRYAKEARHRFEKVNSSHHQAVDRLGEGLEVEGWSEIDGIIEQIHLRDHPFVLGVQYHPERSEIYGCLFEEFFEYVLRNDRFFAPAGPNCP